MERAIDLNVDIGEGLRIETDVALLDLVTSANIACGGHAGDREIMERTSRAALARGVRIGAHPSYPDRANFGRVTVEMPLTELMEEVTGQVQALVDITPIAYMKPHGALYNDAVANRELAKALSDLGWPLMLLDGSPYAAISEGFVDRAYRDDGRLVPRTEPGALITDLSLAADQAVSLAAKVDSLCVHSDTPGAIEILSAARRALEAAGYEISAT